ncbi:hypothetical protein [Pseudomonas asiatica]|uniref:hypothetical protein n=1 Tax=Pseudomonas asiatica TaxID=2219225 RepID=UPI0034576776
MTKKRAPLSTCPVDPKVAVTLPTSVVKAMRTEFGVPITAFISAAAYGAGNMYLEGVVFADRGGRFDDGDTIRTSIILNSEAVDGFLVVQTLSSIYVVADWLGGTFSEASISNH